MKLTIKSAADEKSDMRDLKKAELARFRWEHQTGGLTLPNGKFIRTDDATRAALTEAVNSFKAGLMTMQVPWKMADGSWVELGEAELLAITSAVTAHV